MRGTPQMGVFQQPANLSEDLTYSDAIFKRSPILLLRSIKGLLLFSYSNAKELMRVISLLITFSYKSKNSTVSITILGCR
jgi:hypothetical protein